MRTKIAVQKKGRLFEDTISLFQKAGFEFKKDSTGFIMKCTNAEIDLILLRDDDIPQYVEDGVADIGIVGENVLLEKNKNLKVVDKLGFGKCCLAVD